MRERSMASYELSSSNRCCGSIARASRGEMPKKRGSKPATSSRNAPCLVERRASTSQPRSVGKPPTASVPDTISRQKSSGVRTPPGNRHAMETMAIGSSVLSCAATTGAASCVPSNSSSRYPASASGFG